MVGFYILFSPSFVLAVEGPDQSILNFPLVYSPGGQKLYEEINWNLMRLLSGDERERRNTNCLNHHNFTRQNIICIQNCS